VRIPEVDAQARWLEEQPVAGAAQDGPGDAAA
jgi:hypothetical protein